MHPNEPLDIRFDCPHCGVALAYPREMHRPEGPCPACGTTIRAPEPARAVLLPPPREQADEPRRAAVARLRDGRGSRTFMGRPFGDVMLHADEW